MSVPVISAGVIQLLGIVHQLQEPIIPVSIETNTIWRNTSLLAEHLILIAYCF